MARADRHAIWAWTSSSDAAASLLAVAASSLLVPALGVKGFGELRGERREIRELSGLLQPDQCRGELALSSLRIAGEQLDGARPRRGRRCKDRAPERGQEPVGLGGTRPRLVELPGHRCEPRRGDEEQALRDRLVRRLREQLGDSFTRLRHR